MQVKQKLRIHAAVSGGAVLAIFVVLVLTIYRVNRSLEALQIAAAIKTAAFERLILRTDNHRTGSERSKTQLIAKHRQVGKLLNAASERFTDPEDKKVVQELLDIHESIGKFSRTIRENREKRGPHAPPDALSQELEDRLLSQLNMRVYETILLDSKLQESAKGAVVSSLRLAGGGILIVLLLIGSTTLINGRIMGRSIADRVRRLYDGSLVIGEGNLDFRLDLEGDDEFSELAGAFNAMARKLSGSYRALECEINERRRAEAALRESEERLRLLGDNLPDSAVYQYLHEPDGRVRFLYFSAGMERLNGVRVEEVLADATTLHRQVPPEYIERLVAAEAKSAREMTDFDMEVPMQRPDGQVRWMRLHSRPRQLPDGPVIWDGVQTDVTGRKQAEEALQYALDELENQVQERTRELAEKEVLLKEIHHRVKNNLQVISSLVGLQADGSRDETVREVLRDVTFRVRSMALVHEKLYQSADLARIDFAEYTRGLLGYLWRAHGAAAATVRLNLDLEPVLLPVDIAAPCGLILNELAGNALKHAFRGRSAGEVRVSLHSVSDGRTRLSVADNGVGLPPGFDWRQARSLGLHLVRMLSGQLDASVEASGGDGTEFELVFSNQPAEE